ncbi:hypothetical protein [Corallococcus sp. CA047B]|uniref:hypothetical protein n=1 Tax=Corallococcus sp. CA047B TaxID=2316729 RepID=UPI0011C37BC7|nr:hypothetical protein [Corallococcus sp. CA047B]
MLNAAHLGVQVPELVKAAEPLRIRGESDAVLLGRVLHEAVASWRLLTELRAATCRPGRVLDMPGRIQDLADDSGRLLRAARDRATEMESKRDALHAQVQAVRPILSLLVALSAHPVADENAVILSMDCEEVAAPWHLTYGMARAIVAALSTAPAEVCPEPFAVQGNRKPSANPGFAGRVVRVLGEATEGTEHPHTVRLVLCRFPGGEDVPYLEVSERGGPHTGGRILALSTVVHALINLSDDELFALGNREPPPKGPPLAERVNVSLAKVGHELTPMGSQVTDAMHPTGRCTCAGEGACEWCRARCSICGWAYVHGSVRHALSQVWSALHITTTRQGIAVAVLRAAYPELPVPEELDIVEGEMARRVLAAAVLDSAKLGAENMRELACADLMAAPPGTDRFTFAARIRHLPLPGEEVPRG